MDIAIFVETSLNPLYSIQRVGYAINSAIQEASGLTEREIKDPVNHESWKFCSVEFSDLFFLDARRLRAYPFKFSFVFDGQEEQLIFWALPERLMYDEGFRLPQGKNKGILIEVDNAECSQKMLELVASWLESMSTGYAWVFQCGKWWRIGTLKHICTSM